MLTSNKLWSSIIDGSRADAFRELVAARVVPFVSRASAVAGANLDPLAVKGLALRAVGKVIFLIALILSFPLARDTATGDLPHREYALLASPVV